MTPSDPAPQRVLIIDPAFLGDAVFDAALARAVKQRWPNAEVGLVLRPPADQLAEVMTYVDRVHVFDKYGRDAGWAGLRRVAADLKAQAYELALIPHPSVRSAALAALAQIPQRRGNSEGWLAGRFLTERRAAPPNEGFVARRLRLLGPPAGEQGLGGVMRLSPKEPVVSGRIGLVLGSEWETKRWPVRQAARWIAELVSQPAEVLVLGSAREGPLLDALRQALGEAASVPVIDGMGGDIMQLVRRLASCEVLIAGDTGPLHIARALGVPTVALFGPTDPALHRPSALDRVLTVEIDCRPCSAHGHHRCPKGHHRCLEDLAPERVQAAVAELRIGGPS